MGTRLQSPDKFGIKDPRETVDRISRFIRQQYEESGVAKLILGLSGGLDSSVTAYLCAHAVGGRNVLGVCLPERETLNTRNIQDARSVAEKCRILFRLEDITPMLEAARTILKEAAPTRHKKVAWGNLKARVRAVVLYYHANTINGLVVGTGDKSESMLGYFTKYGDGACDLQPLADVYKSSVRILAKHLRLPKRVYSKPPSPELWPGQTAEEELGLDYDKIDQILWGLERWLGSEEIARDISLPVSIVSSVERRWLASEHKRRVPIAPKLGFRTIGMDLRLPFPRGGGN